MRLDTAIEPMTESHTTTVSMHIHMRYLPYWVGGVVEATAAPTPSQAARQKTALCLLVTPRPPPPPF